MIVCLWKKSVEGLGLGEIYRRGREDFWRVSSDRKGPQPASRRLSSSPFADESKRRKRINLKKKLKSKCWDGKENGERLLLPRPLARNRGTKLGKEPPSVNRKPSKASIRWPPVRRYRQVGPLHQQCGRTHWMVHPPSVLACAKMWVFFLTPPGGTTDGRIRRSSAPFTSCRKVD